MDFDEGKKCPVCENRESTVVGKPQISTVAATYIREDYRVVKCNECQFYYVLPKISFTDKEWQKLYGDEYFPEIPKWWKEKRGRDRKFRLDLLEKHYKGKVRRLLDIGCGEGLILIDAAKRDWEVHGLDIYDNRTEEAKGRNIRFTKGTIFESSFPDEYFDCIYLDSVLEHVLDPRGYLKEINRMLVKGGVVYIGVPNEDSLFNDARKIIFSIMGKPDIAVRAKPFVSPYHVVGFNRKSFKLILSECGFDILRLRNFSGEFDWRKHKAFTRPFFIQLFLLPVHLLAIPLGKRIYLDVIARKTTDE